MSSASDIEWTDATWNPVRGCALVSPGCENCYAMKFAHRFSGAGGRYEGLTVVGNHGPRWTGAARPVAEMLGEPLKWKKARRIFVNSMSDLFHEDVPDEYIAAVFGVMASAPQHTFQILTKRAERMAQWFDWVEKTTALGPQSRWARADLCQRAALDHGLTGILHPIKGTLRAWPWPLPNVWLGVSVEDQQRADERIPRLLRTPAAVRFLSCEPLIEGVKLMPWLRLSRFVEDYKEIAADAGGEERLPSHLRWNGKVPPQLHWVIVGGESGHGARQFNAEWARSITQQCRAVGVPVFVKQLGSFVVDRNDRFNTSQDTGAPADWWPLDDPDRVEENINGFREEYQGAPVRIRLLDRKGGDMNEWPHDLRLREFPKTRTT